MLILRVAAMLLLFFGALGAPAASAAESPAVASFPPALDSYPTQAGATLAGILKERIQVEPFNLVASILFLLAIVHTFLAPRFLHLAHELDHRLKTLEATRAGSVAEQNLRGRLRFGAYALHLLGEVEAIFGIWVIPLMIAISLTKGWPTARDYVAHSRNFTEPLFVVVVMTIAASRPILELSEWIMSIAARLGRSSTAAWWFSILTIGPLLGSFITEPAAMTISALLLSRKFYQLHPSPRFAYATIGLLFVNVSVGGTLTHFAAPPVLMVAGQWGWGFAHMLEHFGWKALIGIVFSNAVYFVFFWGEFRKLTGNSVESANPKPATAAPSAPVPFLVTAVHLAFLAWTVVNNHYPTLFIGAFLFYLAFTGATDYYQSEVTLRPALLVGFFLAGLVVHGGLQGWWIGPVLRRLDEVPLFFGATILTAFNDNAAITYLASLVPDFSANLQYAIVAGAVVGGGLTVIANAPNPAGQSILSKFFPDGVSPLGLLLGALAPTVIVGAVFLIFR
jgi:hypothetical protein